MSKYLKPIVIRILGYLFVLAPEFFWGDRKKHQQSHRGFKVKFIQFLGRLKAIISAEMKFHGLFCCFGCHHANRYLNNPNARQVDHEVSEGLMKVPKTTFESIPWSWGLAFFCWNTCGFCSFLAWHVFLVPFFVSLSNGVPNKKDWFGRKGDGWWLYWYCWSAPGAALRETLAEILEETTRN